MSVALAILMVVIVGIIGLIVNNVILSRIKKGIIQIGENVCNENKFRISKYFHPVLQYLMITGMGYVLRQKYE